MTGACEGRVVSGNDLGVGCFNGEVWVDARQHREKQEKMRMWPHPGDSFENLRSILLVPFPKHLKIQCCFGKVRGYVHGGVVNHCLPGGEVSFPSILNEEGKKHN